MCKNGAVRDAAGVKALLQACQSAAHVDPGIEKLAASVSDLLATRTAEQDLKDLSAAVEKLMTQHDEGAVTPGTVAALHGAWEKTKDLVKKKEAMQELLSHAVEPLEVCFANRLAAADDVVETDSLWNMMPMILEVAKELLEARRNRIGSRVFFVLWGKWR